MLFFAVLFFAAVFSAGLFFAAVFLAGLFFAAVFSAAFFLAGSCSAALSSAALCFAAVVFFFATMAAAPSHIVILRANRAGTINRLRSRGNGARRPIRPPTVRRAASMHALCPAPRPVIRRNAPGPHVRGPTPGRRHSGHPETGRPLSARRRTLGAANGMDGDE